MVLHVPLAFSSILFLLYLLCYSPFYYTFMEVIIYFHLFIYHLFYHISSIYLSLIYFYLSISNVLTIINEKYILLYSNKNMDFGIIISNIVEWLFFFFCHYNCCWYMKLFGDPIQGATHWRMTTFHQEIKRTTVNPHNHL